MPTNQQPNPITCQLVERSTTHRLFALLLSAREPPSILPSYWASHPGNLLQFRYETVTKARAICLPYGGASPSFFVYSWNQRNPNNPRKGRKMEHKYQGKIRFTTDKELTDRELQQLIFAIEVQIEEPTDSNGDDENFKTSMVLVELEPTIQTTKPNRFKKMMGSDINCWTTNFHFALDYVATLVTSGKVVLTPETDLEKIAKGFDTEDHNGEDIYGLFHLFLMFTASKLDLDSLGIEEEELSKYGLTEDDLVQMFEGDPVNVARLLREAQQEFQPKYSN